MNATAVTPTTLPVLNLGTLGRDLTTGQFVTTYTLRYTTVRSGIAAAMLCSAPSSMTGWIRKSGCLVASSGTEISVSDDPFA